MGVSKNGCCWCRYWYTYFPICDEGYLGLWLLLDAFEKGVVFALDPAGPGKQRIRCQLHLKYETPGKYGPPYGFSNYITAKTEMKEHLESLIAECFLRGIFTPKQLDEFWEEENK